MRYPIAKEQTNAVHPWKIRFTVKTMPFSKLSKKIAQRGVLRKKCKCKMRGPQWTPGLPSLSHFQLPRSWSTKKRGRLGGHGHNGNLALTPDSTSTYGKLAANLPHIGAVKEFSSRCLAAGISDDVAEFLCCLCWFLIRGGALLRRGHWGQWVYDLRLQQTMSKLSRGKCIVLHVTSFGLMRPRLTDVFLQQKGTLCVDDF